MKIKNPAKRQTNKILARLLSHYLATLSQQIHLSTNPL
jgi:hypothetical protein